MSVPVELPLGFEGHFIPPQEGLLFADDFGNLPGEFGPGPLILTECGQPTGCITPGGEAFFWLRYDPPPEGFSPAAFRCCIRMSGMAIGERPRLLARMWRALRRLLGRLQ